MAVLGLIAIVMSIRAEDKWGHYERAGWFLFAALLVAAEIQAGITDRNQHDAYERSVRDSQNKQFQAILDQNQRDFSATLRKMQAEIDLSSKNMKLSQNALQQITGGGSYCYLMATVSVATNTGTSWELAVMNAGEYPLDICHVLIHKNFQPKSAQDAEQLMEVIVDQQLGPLPPGKTKNGSEGFMTRIILPAGSYYIQINTRNDRFYETLTIHPDDKSKGLEDIEVRDQKWNLVYQQPPKK